MRIDPLRFASRIENMLGWFAASVLTATMVIYALRRDGSSARARPAVVNPSPAQEPLDLQLARAAERGRGRKAPTPVHIPWAGLKDILFRSGNEIINDRLMAVAGGVVFYSLLSLFPAIAAGVSTYAMVSNASTIADHVSLADGIVPSIALDMFRDEIMRIAGKSDGKLTLGFAIGFVVALWSANAGMKSMFEALNVIYDEQDKRGIIKLNLVSLFFTLCAIAAAMLAAGAVVVFPLVLAALGLSPLDKPIIGLLRWPLMFVVLIIGLAVLYRYGPSRRRAKWRWITVGSVSAALAWLAASALYSWYLSNFANYNATYGALGAVAGLMMWMWIGTLVVLAGAELNAEIEHQTAHDSTVGPAKPLGARGAVMADTVGAAQS